MFTLFKRILVQSHGFLKRLMLVFTIYKNFTVNIGFFGAVIKAKRIKKTTICSVSLHVLTSFQERF